MDNILCICINLVFIVITLIMLPGAIKIDRRHSQGYFLTAFYLCLFAWQAFAISIFIIKNPWWIRNLYDWAFIPMGFAIALFFLLIMRFFRVEMYFQKKHMALLFIIPIISSILALTTTQHGLYRVSFEVVATSPLLVVENVRGIWFYIQFAYYSIFTVTALVISISRYRKLPPAYRRGPFWLVVLVAFCVLGAALSFLNVWIPELDLFLFCLGAGSVIFHMVSIINDQLGYISFERKEIFNFLPEQIFILNSRGEIMDANVRAKRTLENYNIEVGNRVLADVMAQLEAEGLIVMKPALDGVGTDIYVHTHAYHDVYNMRSFDVTSTDESAIGRTVIITDVSKNRLTIERYNELAGVDPLTGLFNRYYYQNLLGELDTPANLPLSFIVGDLNGLKQANDTKGHDYGDELLRAVARTLTACCPPDGYAARIGGDEFIMLLPGRDLAEAERIIEALRTRAESEPLLTSSSVAFGCATKTTPDMNINRLFDDADYNMYKDKG